MTIGNRVSVVCAVLLAFTLMVGGVSLYCLQTLKTDLRVAQQASNPGIDAAKTGLASAETERAVANSMLLIQALLGAGGALAIGLTFLLVRFINSRLRSMGGLLTGCIGQLTGAAAQVATGSQAFAQGASEQAATLEETAASSEELAAMTRKNSANTNAAADVVQAVDVRVAETNRTLEQMVSSMNEINASSDKISRIIKVIDEIAFQTNILALNAAVEAARAGEAGMGFAVVAGEVRNLAQRSAQAARDTTQLIEESISRSYEGKTKLAEVSESIKAITESALQVKTLMDEVTVGSQEQSKGIENIAKAIQEMERVTQSSASGAERSAASSEELLTMAGQMRAAIERLAAMAGQAPAPERPAANVNQPNRRPERAAVESRSYAPLPVMNRKAAPSETTQADFAVAASRIDRSEFPLDDDFKAF